MENSINEKLKTLKIIHILFCVGLIIAYFIIGDIKSLDDLKLPIIDSSSIIYLGIPIIAFLLSDFLFKSQLKKADPKLSLEEKIPIYQSASIIRWAVLEVAAVLLIIFKEDFFNFWNIYNRISPLLKSNKR